VAFFVVISKKIQHGVACAFFLFLTRNGRIYKKKDNFRLRRKKENKKNFFVTAFLLPGGRRKKAQEGEKRAKNAHNDKSLCPAQNLE